MTPESLPLLPAGLVSAQVRQVRRTGAAEVTLTLHAPGVGETAWVLSADPQGARFLRAFAPVAALEAAGPFVLLARARLRGSRVVSASLSQGQVVELVISGGEGTHGLVLEMNGRESRVLLLDSTRAVLATLPGTAGPPVSPEAGAAYALPGKLRRMAAGAPARLPPDDEDEARRADAAWRDWLAEGEAAAARAAVLRRIRAHLAKLERRRGRIAADRAALADADALRRWGELLQIHRHALRPGQSGITVADEFTEGRPPVTIPLDPALDPAGNIAALFQEYRKRRDSAAHVERRGAQTEAEIGRWRGILQRATAGAGPAGAGLAALLASLTPADRAVATPAPAPKEGGAPPAGPMTRVSSDGFTILIGRSKVENDEVTFRIGRGRDWWFHALGIPGAHVLVRNPSGNPLPPATQREAAWLAAYYSKGRPRGAMEVAATQRKHVRKVKGGEPGEVTYAHGHTLWVDLADARGRAILGGEEEGRRDGASGPG